MSLSWLVSSDFTSGIIHKGPDFPLRMELSPTMIRRKWRVSLYDALTGRVNRIVGPLEHCSKMVTLNFSSQLSEGRLCQFSSTPERLQQVKGVEGRRGGTVYWNFSTVFPPRDIRCSSFREEVGCILPDSVLVLYLHSHFGESRVSSRQNRLLERMGLIRWE